MGQDTSTPRKQSATLAAGRAHEPRIATVPACNAAQAEPPPRAPPAKQTTARDPLIGALLHERYRVRRRIGKGGMGVVYVAEHVLLRRDVAIKLLMPPACGSDELVERFQREALAAAAIGNEHVVGISDMGRLDDGSHFLALEYLEGIELANAVAEAGCLPIGRALRIVAQLCDALTAVHAAGIVHRDLKPENVFLVERDGSPDFVKVLDFGVCKLREPQAGLDQHLTVTGNAVGTPPFMAPEQVEGLPDVDHRTDIYAVGAILFHALTGVPPFEAPSLPRLFMRICLEPPPSLSLLRPDVPEALAAVVDRALAKSPAERFQSSAELKQALSGFLDCGDEVPVRAATGGGLERESLLLPVDIPGRRRWSTAAVIAAGIALVSALFWQLAPSGGSARDGKAVRAAAQQENAAPNDQQGALAPPVQGAAAPIPTVRAPVEPIGSARVEARPRSHRPASAPRPEVASPAAASAAPASATPPSAGDPAAGPSPAAPRDDVQTPEPQTDRWPPPLQLKPVF